MGTERVEALKPEYLLLTRRGATWLNGFAADDRETARRLIHGLTLVSLSNFSQTIECMLHAEAEAIDGPVALYAVREVDPTRSYFGQATAGRHRKVKTVDAVGRGWDIGSEGHVASTLRNIAKADPRKFLSHPTVEKMREKKCRAIIVVDDLIGSGKRTREFLDAIWQDRTIRSWWSLDYIRFIVVAFAGTRAGLYRVRRATYHPSVSISRDCPTYMELPWSAAERRRLAQLCKTYAAQTSKPNFALGYRDTMASLVFEHGCPNNVPAILWAPRAKGTRWRPLFPNRAVSQDEQSVFPPEVARRDPVAVLIDAGQPKLARTGLRRIGGVEPKRTVTLLALIAKGVRRNSALAFATGLSNAELETVLRRCTGWGLITPTRRITAAGLAELAHVRRGHWLKPGVPELGGEAYYPRSLREATGG